MSPRKHTVDAAKGVLEIEWPFFGELSRGLALKVARAYDPEIVIGIATAGVIPGAVIAAILGREFHSLVVSRKYRIAQTRENAGDLRHRAQGSPRQASADRRRDLRLRRYHSAGRVGSSRSRRRGDSRRRSRSDRGCTLPTFTRSRPRVRSSCRGTERFSSTASSRRIHCTLTRFLAED